MNELDIAWAAGFFDGEGSALVEKTNTGYTIVVNVANNNKEAIDFFHKNWGGRIVCITKEKWAEYGRKANQDAYQLKFNHNDAARLLLDLYPYLIAKKLHARIVMSALASIPEQRQGKRIPRGFTQLLKPFYEEMEEKGFIHSSK